VIGTSGAPSCWDSSDRSRRRSPLGEPESSLPLLLSAGSASIDVAGCRATSIASSWFQRQTPPADVGRNGKVALFYTTPVEYNAPETGRATVRVLWRSGIDVDCPDQVCCGMPALDAGDVAGATRRARFNLERLGRAVDQGRDVVVPGPTCSRMLKQEYPRLLPGERTAHVSAHVFDLGEYLMTARRRQARPGFRGGLAPSPVMRPVISACRRRSVVRLRTARPGTSVEVLELHGMDGVGIQAGVLRRVGEDIRPCCATSTR
jgi:hypothetical protein